MRIKKMTARVLEKYSNAKFEDIVQAIAEGDIAALASFPILGRGDEATVFALPSPHWVLKMSNPKNIRIEYELFSSSKYQDITPDVREKDETEGKWMVVERVTPLGSGNWEQLMKHFPSLVKLDDSMEWGRWWAWDNTLREFEEAYPSYPPKATQLAKKETEWIYHCVALHKSMGLSVYDVKPGNLGVDSKGMLVILDVFTG